VLSYTAAKCYSSIIAERLSSRLTQHQQLTAPASSLLLSPASEHHSRDVYTTGDWIYYVVFIPCPSDCVSVVSMLSSPTHVKSCISSRERRHVTCCIVSIATCYQSYSSLSFSVPFSVHYILHLHHPQESFRLWPKYTIVYSWCIIFSSTLPYPNEVVWPSEFLQSARSVVYTYTHVINI